MTKEGTINTFLVSYGKLDNCSRGAVCICVRAGSLARGRRWGSPPSASQPGSLRAGPIHRSLHRSTPALQHHTYYYQDGLLCHQGRRRRTTSQQTASQPEQLLLLLLLKVRCVNSPEVLTEHENIDHSETTTKEQCRLETTLDRFPQLVCVCLQNGKDCEEG